MASPDRQPQLPSRPLAAGIAVENLTVGYNGRPAVVDVSLELRAGSICALVGMNGAGKSTLFKALMGFLRPSAGSIRLGGLSLRQAQRRQLVAYVPQSEQVDWQFPIRVWATEGLTVPEGQLEGGTAHMIEQDQELVRMDAGPLRRGAEEELRMAHQILVERVAGRDQHPQGRTLTTSGPPQPLPGGGDRARIAIQHRHVQSPDVDPEFQGGRAHHHVHTPRAQGLLRDPPLAGKIAAAVGEDPRRPAGVTVEYVLQVLGDDLHHEPGAREDDALEAQFGRGARDAGGLGAGGGADAKIGVDHRRVPQQQPALAPRRTAFGYGGDGLPDQALRELTRVGYGGGSEDEARRHAVEAADPPETAQDVGHV